MKPDCDLLIVGCGIAGTSAAVTALQGGLKVVMLERAPEEEFGGNSRWTEAYLRMKNDAEVSDDFEERFAQNAGANLDPNVLDAVAGEYAHWPAIVKAHPLPDPELIAHFAQGVPPAIAWLKSFGLRFGPQPIYLLTQSTTRIAAQGGGLALIERLMKEARALGADVRFRTTAVDLVRDADGRIGGVKVVGPDGKRSEISAHATLLASGGYEGNPEMMTHYLGTGPRTSGQWRAAATTTRARASAWRSPRALRRQVTSARITPSRSIRARASPRRWCTSTHTGSSSTTSGCAS